MRDVIDDAPGRGTCRVLPGNPPKRGPRPDPRGSGPDLGLVVQHNRDRCTSRHTATHPPGTHPWNRAFNFNLASSR